VWNLQRLVTRTEKKKKKVNNCLQHTMHNIFDMAIPAPLVVTPSSGLMLLLLLLLLLLWSCSYLGFCVGAIVAFILNMIMPQEEADVVPAITKGDGSSTPDLEDQKVGQSWGPGFRVQG
jgi:hypothetical protein